MEWPGEGGSPIPQVTVEDPNMMPGDVPRQGAQGHLANPHGTSVLQFREQTTPLTPDRVVIRTAPKTQRKAKKREPLNQTTPEKTVLDSPARNTRSRAATNRMVEETIKSLYPTKQTLQIHGLPTLLHIDSIQIVNSVIMRSISREGVDRVKWPPPKPPLNLYSR